MRFDRLNIPRGLGGQIWRHEISQGDRRPFAPHVHAELESNLVYGGRGAYIIDGRRYELRPGTLLWLFPRQVHLLIEHSDDFAMWIGVYRPRLLKLICHEPTNRELMRPRPRGMFCKQLPAGQVERFLQMSEHLDAIGLEADRFNTGLAHLLLEMWSAFADAEEIDDAADVHPAVQRAAQRLRHDMEPLTMQDVADEAGLSLSHLSRLFRQQVGVSMVSFRQRCCIEQFFERYRHGHRLNMTEAALQSGFGSYVHFHRVFRKLIGVGPAEHFRQQRDDPLRKAVPPLRKT